MIPEVVEAVAEHIYEAYPCAKPRVSSVLVSSTEVYWVITIDAEEEDLILSFGGHELQELQVLIEEPGDVVSIERGLLYDAASLESILNLVGSFCRSKCRHPNVATDRKRRRKS